MSIIWIAMFPTENIWPHLAATVLPRYLSNSLLLMTAVAAITGVVGTVTAWLVVMRSFPGRAVLEWALLLPLAMPGYIAAYALVDFWEFAGPAQTFLRSLFGWESAADYWFPNVRSRGGAILVLSLSLYPYVYLLARSAFRDQSAGVLEVARTLGCGSFGSFLRVGLPLARPAILGGMAIAMMETLNEFGAVEYFAVQTLTTGIFTTWLESSNAGGAAQIASLILVIVVVLVLVEKSSRRRIRFHQESRRQSGTVGEPLSGPSALAAVVACSAPVVLGFLMPFAIVLSHAIDNAHLWFLASLWSSVWTTFWVAIFAGIFTVSAGVIMIYGIRLSRSPVISALAPVTTIGYAAPGVVLGLGILIPVAAFDHVLADSILFLTGFEIGLLLTGSGAAVVMACSIRFFALAFSTTDAAFDRLKPSLGHAARSLGKSPAATLARVYLPLLRGSLLTAGLLVFVDSAKELPATLLLRPFGFNTLATRTYDFASLEDIGRASPAATMVVLVSLVSVMVIAASSRNSGPATR